MDTTLLLFFWVFLFREQKKYFKKRTSELFLVSIKIVRIFTARS